jgi:hypothetical protein
MNPTTFIENIKRAHTLGFAGTLTTDFQTHYKITGDPKNIILRVGWMRGVGNYVTYFTEKGVEEAQVDDNRIWLKEETGENVLIALYQLAPMTFRD